LKAGIIDMGFCVPEDWTDQQVIDFAESHYPCGTKTGWRIIREGDFRLGGCPERNPCESRAGYVHIAVQA
jgi:hypothetical protein